MNNRFLIQWSANGKSIVADFLNRKPSATIGSMAKRNISSARSVVSYLKKIPAVHAVFVHGSTAYNDARWSPNLGRIKLRKGKSIVGYEFYATEPVADDVDMFCIVENMQSLEEISEGIRLVSSERNISFTVNVVCKKDFLANIGGPGSPAVRRILLFKRLLPLINPKWINEAKKKARKSQTWLDYLVELDFQMQMTLSQEMRQKVVSRFKLTNEELERYFPILCLCSVTNLDVGFPKKRAKLVFPPQDNLDYIKDV